MRDSECQDFVLARASVFARACACMRASERACVRACVRACMPAHTYCRTVKCYVQLIVCNYLSCLFHYLISLAHTHVTNCRIVKHHSLAEDLKT